MASSHVGDPVEPLLDLGDSRRIRVERAGEATQVARDLAEPNDELAQLRGGGLELGRQALEWCDRPLRRGGERACAVAVVGVERGEGGLRAFAKLRHVPDTLALGSKLVLLAGREALAVLDERLELVEPSALGVGAALQLLDPMRGCLDTAPRVARLGASASLLGADERVEQIELVRRPGEPALGELPRQREQPFGRRHDVLSGDAPPPGIRAGPSFGRDAARDDEAGLTLGT